MTTKFLLFWVLGSGSALLGCLWLLHETRARAAEKQLSNEKMLIWLLGGSAAAVTLGWELFRLYLDQP
ncbi:hypothetical protein [Pyxidicoccus sp. MSG2]|uniref:hypothetical protein n=1 Tax=Pyxidicoccus sp. MSG2 TaxID=2996790 RepID=UPI00226E6DDE|nr:hypothetical protein [Pyxidicoccus sp. MSG2]MCY1023969.1 hypothetical protein [Pyxidicoccus sp. MSG2]